MRTARRALRPAAWPSGPQRRLGSGRGSIHQRPPAARCGGLRLHNAATAPVALRQPACARWLRRHSQPPRLTRRPLRVRARRHSQRFPPAYGVRALHRPARRASPEPTPCDACPAVANALSALAPRLANTKQLTIRSGTVRATARPALLVAAPALVSNRPRGRGQPPYPPVSAALHSSAANQARMLAHIYSVIPNLNQGKIATRPIFWRAFSHILRSRIRNPLGPCGLAWSEALCPGAGALRGPTRPVGASLEFEERADTRVGMAGARHCPLWRLPAATLAHCFVSNKTEKPKKARITVSNLRRYRFI